MASKLPATGFHCFLRKAGPGTQRARGGYKRGNLRKELVTWLCLRKVGELEGPLAGGEEPPGVSAKWRNGGPRTHVCSMGKKKKNCGKIVSNSLLRRFQCKSSLPSLLWNHSKLPANPFERLYYLWWPRVRESSVTTVVQARMKVNMGMWGHDGDIPWEEYGEWRGLRERPGEALRSLEKRAIPNLSIHFPLSSKHLKQKKKIQPVRGKWLGFGV